MAYYHGGKSYIAYGRRVDELTSREEQAFEKWLKGNGDRDNCPDDPNGLKAAVTEVAPAVRSSIDDSLKRMSNWIDENESGLRITAAVSGIAGVLAGLVALGLAVSAPVTVPTTVVVASLAWFLEGSSRES